MPLLRTGTEDIQWKLVGTGRQERKDQWKRERCAHQATAPRYSSCEQSRCLCQWRGIREYGTVTCADCSSVQSTDRIGSFRRQRIDATSRIPIDRFESQTAWNKADWTTSRWAAWSYFEVSETPCRSGDRQSGSRSYHYQRDRGHGELSNPTRRTRTTPHYIQGGSQSRRAEQWDARMGGEYSVINRQTHVGKQYYRQRGCRSITSWIDGTGPSSCTARRTAGWSIEQHYRRVRCNEPWEQARRMCRLVTKHEQSETHNENDDRRNAATRGYQDPQTERNVRFLIASINVTSAVSGSGGAKERTYETGGLNMTGRMAELDYLFSDADLDIIGVQESRLPQTQILQTNGYTVFNSGAMPGKHHYGVQLWVKKHHAKAVKCTEAVSPRLLIAKIVMRAVSSDTVARMSHVFVLHAPCEVAFPHESDAFYMQVHERLNAVPRGQLCLIFGRLQRSCWEYCCRLF